MAGKQEDSRKGRLDILARHLNQQNGKGKSLSCAPCSAENTSSSIKPGTRSI
uniref:Uncharacterized protein n=1 Tax=Ciona savignyi TaxID=51511 RepID=H2Y722_CIOSA